ncbi:hypothetical protein ACIQU4_38510 [Streptomyces sp. NPDC090741]|uniref:hypothetical protein n=1 Tax=Streptomyces sp. NPDC090741 TaxID=3365967 RepID=UPI0037F46F6C
MPALLALRGSGPVSHALPNRSRGATIAAVLRADEPLSTTGSVPTTEPAAGEAR